MKVVHHIEDCPPLPCALSIGSFDGVHLGHQYLFDQMRTFAPHRAILTFDPHPSYVLKNRPPMPLICSTSEKLKLLEKAGIDLVILLPFTLELAQIPYDRFLENLKGHLPFTHLVLGKGSAFGKNREGDENHIRELCPILGFKAHYIDKFTLDGAPVSSGLIRDYLQKASDLLGRSLFKE